jgi:hypothetical protein
MILQKKRKFPRGGPSQARLIIAIVVMIASHESTSSR